MERFPGYTLDKCLELTFPQLEGLLSWIVDHPLPVVVALDRMPKLSH